MGASHAKTPRNAALVLVALGLLSVVAPTEHAAAQRRPREAQDGSGGAAPGYRALIDEALAEFDRANFDEALALFRRAHALEPNARTLRGMGFCLFEIRQYVDAVRLLGQAMTDTRSPLSPAQRSSTQQVLDRAAAFVAHVRVELVPADAQLLVDGKEPNLDETGSLRLDPGEHELSASATEYSSRTLRVSVQSGQNEPVKLELARNLIAPPPVAAAASPSLVERDATSAPRDRALLKRKLMIAGFAIAGAALVVGTVTGGLTLGRKNKLEDECPDKVCASSDADRLDSARTLSWVSTGSFVVAGVGAVIGLTGVFLPVADKRRARRADLRLSAGLRSVALSGHF